MQPSPDRSFAENLLYLLTDRHDDEQAKTMARVLNAARVMLGPANVIEMPSPSMGSEDYAWFAERVPSAHLRIGSQIEGLNTAIHRADYQLNEQVIPLGMKVMTAYRAAISYGPKDADAHLQLGHVLKLQGRGAEARAVYRRALELAPEKIGQI